MAGGAGRGSACLVDSVLDYWNYSRQAVAALTQQALLATVNDPTAVVSE